MPNLFDDYDARNNLTLDFSNEIEKAVNEISRAVADAKEGKIKDLLEQAFRAGFSRNVDFEQWLADLQERIRNDGV